MQEPIDSLKEESAFGAKTSGSFVTIFGCWGGGIISLSLPFHISPSIWIALFL